MSPSAGLFLVFNGLILCQQGVLALWPFSGATQEEAATRRTAHFMHGRVETTRRLPSKRRSMRQGGSELDEVPQVWIVGLEPHQQGTVHKTLTDLHGSVLHPLTGDDHHWVVHATDRAVRKLLDSHPEVTVAYLPNPLKLSPGIKELLNEEPEPEIAPSRGEPIREMEALQASALKAHSKQKKAKKRGVLSLIALVPSSTPTELSKMQQACRAEMPALLADIDACSYRVTVSRDSLQLTVCAQGLEVAAAWLTEQSRVTWVDVQHRMVPMNLHASASLQAPEKMNSTPPSTDVFKGVASHFFPYWAKGITGKGQVVGVVDSGADMDSCFLWDPAFVNYTSDNSSLITLPVPKYMPQNLDTFENSFIGPVSGLPNVTVFQNTTHRKVVQYVFWSDRTDDTIGHGTHVSTTIAGSAYGFNWTTQPLLGTGMAPDAKIAFFDVGGVDANGSPNTALDFYTGQDPGQIYEIQRQAGARITSNSYGTRLYDYTAPHCYLLDAYTWAKNDTLHVYAAGNDGDIQSRKTTTGTVGYPATCKNVLAVGATEGWIDKGNENLPVFKLLTDNMTAIDIDTSTYMPPPRTQKDSSQGVLTFQSPEANFTNIADSGNGDFYFMEDFNSTFAGLAGKNITMVAAQPIDACTPVTNNLANLTRPVVLLVRKQFPVADKGCYGKVSVSNSYASGADAVLMYWDDEDAVVISPAPSMNGTSFPAATTYKALGLNLSSILAAGKSVTMTWKPSEAVADNAWPLGNVAWFSSYGSGANKTVRPSSGFNPDVRIKPEVVAPGYIVSAASDGKYAGQMDQCSVVGWAGTSMATPVVAGAAALVRQYFTDGFYPQGRADARFAHDPSAALMKAMLIGGTAALRGISIIDKQPLAPPPSQYQGFGRIDLSSTMPLEDDDKEWRLQVLDNAIFTTDGVAHNFTVKIEECVDAKPLIATLVWHDYPAFPGNLWVLVNNLDLVIEGPSPSVNDTQKVWWGNDFEGGDYSNNVEKIYIPNPVPGATYVISVRSAYLFWGARPQPYSLVVLGGFRGTLDSPYNPAVAKAAADIPPKVSRRQMA